MDPQTPQEPVQEPNQNTDFGVPTVSETPEESIADNKQPPEDLTPMILDTDSTPATMPVPPSEVETSPTESSIIDETPKPPKKSKKGTMLVLIVVAAIVLGLAGYLVYSYTRPTTTTSNQTTSTTDKTIPEIAPKSDLDLTTETLTSAAEGESNITNTDDVSEITDASESTNNVGNSVDEKDF